MSQQPSPCLPHSRTGSFSSRRIPIPQDPQPKIQEQHEDSKYIDLNTTQAQIIILVSPPIEETPQPPGSQPAWFMVTTDRGHWGRTSTGMHLRSTPKIVPELANIISSGLNPYVFRTSITVPSPLTLNTSCRTHHSTQIINSSQSEATNSPSIPPTQPTTPTSHTLQHPTLQGLPLLLKDHDNTKIWSLQTKFNENLKNGPLNMETLVIAMDLVITVLCKENLQHLIIKKPDCITIMKRKLELRP